MNKKGFTLIELLAVIALLTIVIVLAVPNMLKIFTSNKESLSIVQKNQIKSAVEMFLNDYCIEPIDGPQYVCPSSITTTIDNTTGIIKVSSGTITLTALTNAGYFDNNTVTKNCNGSVSITNGNINLDGITCNFSN